MPVHARAGALRLTKLRTATTDDEPEEDQETEFFTDRRGPNGYWSPKKTRVVGYAILQQGHGMPYHQHVRVINRFAVVDDLLMAWFPNR